MNKKKKSLLKNKYFYFVLLFLAMFFFLEDNSLTTSYLLYQKKCKLEEEKNYLREEIVKDSTFVSRLNSSISEVEKYGRETYYMKRNDEDIFIITRDDEKTEN